MIKKILSKIKLYKEYVERIKILKRIGWGWDITTGTVLVHPKFDFYLTKDLVKTLSDRAFDKLIKISTNKYKHWNEVIE